MSKADTYLTNKKFADFQLKIATFKRAKDDRAQRIYGVLEPTAIDEELLTAACFAQGPKGEAGKLAEEEGIEFNSVKHLTLAYLNILTINGLQQMVNLTVLKLKNNIIEKIEGLKLLVNLKQLDLSFNRISKIEHLYSLVNLEDLSLLCNQVSVIENLDYNEKLKFLALGRNKIANIENILYLRRFKHLVCLEIDHNPICNEDGYENYIFAFLINLKYLDHKEILSSWRSKAYEKYQMAVDQMNEAQHEAGLQEKAERENSEFMEQCKRAFVNRVIGDTLFHLLFEKDHDGARLSELASVIEMFDQYRDKVSDACKQLFNTGQEEYQRRYNEEQALRNCIENAKADIKMRALASIAKYKEQRQRNQRKLDDLYQDAFSSIAETINNDIRRGIYDLWNDLMGNEIALVDQLEEVITDFGRNIEEMVSSYVESVQVCFSKVREAAGSFNERLAEMTMTYHERIVKSDTPPSDRDKEVYMDRDNLLISLTNSRDLQIAIIDQEEESIIKNIHIWSKSLLEDIHKNEEFDRHSNRVTEICLFIDSQRVELEMAELANI